MDVDVVASICAKHQVFVCAEGWLSQRIVCSHFIGIIHLIEVSLKLDATDRPCMKIKDSFLTVGSNNHLGRPAAPELREAHSRLNDFIQELWNYYYYKIT